MLCDISANIYLQYDLLKLTNLQSGIDAITQFAVLVFAIWIFQRFLLNRYMHVHIYV